MRIARWNRLAVLLVVIIGLVLLPAVPTLAQDTGGGLDIAGYCAAHGMGEPYSLGRDWYCGGSTWLLPMQEICVWQYGQGSVARNDNYMNPNGWTCEGGLPMATPNPAPTMVPQVQPTPSPTAQRTGTACTSPFSIGEWLQITPGLSNRLRSGAGTSYSILSSLTAGTQVRLLAGPACADGYVWWQIRTPDGRTGWTVEGSGSEYWLEAIPSATATAPTATPTNGPCLSFFTAGMQLHVVAGEARILESGNPQARTVFIALPGATITLVTGPYCSGGQVWWNVQVASGTQGWIAEGANPGLEVSWELPPATPTQRGS